MPTTPPTRRRWSEPSPLSYDAKASPWHWYSLLTAFFYFPLLLIFIAVLPTPLKVIPGLLLSWALWCFITNRTMRVQVGNGQVTWYSTLPFASTRSIAISEIAGVEVNLDERYEVVLRLKDGRRHWVPITIPIKPEEFVGAIVAESPAVAVEREHRGTTS